MMLSIKLLLLVAILQLQEAAKITLIDNAGVAIASSWPSGDTLWANMQGRRIPVAFKDLRRLVVVRDASGNAIWPIPGMLLVNVYFVDNSELKLPVENIKFPVTGLANDLRLSDLRYIVLRSGDRIDGESRYDLLVLRNDQRLEGEILHKIFEVRVFYSSPAEPVIFRFPREQLQRIEIGDSPLEATTNVASTLLGPQKVKAPVHPRYDCIYLRSGDRLTGELQGPGLDVRLASPTAEQQKPGSDARPADVKPPDARRRLVLFEEIKTIDFSSPTSLNSKDR